MPIEIVKIFCPRTKSRMMIELSDNQNIHRACTFIHRACTFSGRTGKNYIRAATMQILRSVQIKRTSVWCITKLFHCCNKWTIYL